MSRSTELENKAKELSKLIAEVSAIAATNNYGLEIDSSGEIEFKDWLSSSCFGEGDDGFGVSSTGSIWYSSSC